VFVFRPAGSNTYTACVEAFESEAAVSKFAARALNQSRRSDVECHPDEWRSLEKIKWTHGGFIQRANAKPVRITYSGYRLCAKDIVSRNELDWFVR
jgi:hypothetical protein